MYQKGMDYVGQRVSLQYLETSKNLISLKKVSNGLHKSWRSTKNAMNCVPLELNFLQCKFEKIKKPIRKEKKLTHKKIINRNCTNQATNNRKIMPTITGITVLPLEHIDLHRFAPIFLLLRCTLLFPFSTCILQINLQHMSYEYKVQ